MVLTLTWPLKPFPERLRQLAFVSAFSLVHKLSFQYKILATKEPCRSNTHFCGLAVPRSGGAQGQWQGDRAPCPAQGEEVTSKVLGEVVLGRLWICCQVPMGPSVQPLPGCWWDQGQ